MNCISKALHVLVPPASKGTSSPTDEA
jgi:hypothetical protein